MSFRAARKNAQKSVAEVQRFMGVSDAAVYMWETGQTMPRGTKLKKLADFYGCTVDELLREDAAAL